MSTAPPTANKKPAEPAPAVRDKFLASLVDILGHEKGIMFYQQGNVTEQELSDLIALATKFDVLHKITGRR